MLAEQADLLGAVRLPSGAHRRTAGTDAITDLLVLRRRDPGEPPDRDPSWVRVQRVDLPGGAEGINTYFVDHPGQVLGRMRVGDGMYGADSLLVDPDGGDLIEALTRACGRIVDGHARPDRPRPDRTVLRLGFPAWLGRLRGWWTRRPRSGRSPTDRPGWTGAWPCRLGRSSR